MRLVSYTRTCPFRGVLNLETTINIKLYYYFTIIFSQNNLTDRLKIKIHHIYTKLVFI